MQAYNVTKIWVGLAVPSLNGRAANGNEIDFGHYAKFQNRIIGYYNLFIVVMNCVCALCMHVLEICDSVSRPYL